MKSIAGIVLDPLEAGDSPGVLTPDEASTAAAAPERLVQSSLYSIFDQGVVSGTNFLTTLVIARSCSQEELGVYSLAWTVILFLAAVQGNLITVPYTMYCHRRTGPSLATYAGSTFLHQLSTSVLAVTCFFVLDVILAAGFGPERLRPAAFVLMGVIPFILLREYARRFPFAHLALTTAVVVDVVVAVVQLAALLALRWFGMLSAAAVYGVMGASCALAAACWWLLDDQPMQFSRERYFADWRRNWSFGRWAMLSQLTGLGFYILPWMLTAVHNEAQTGELAACTTLVGLSNLFVMGLNNLLMPKAARAYADRGPHALCGVLRKTLLFAALVLGSLCILFFFTGNYLGGILFGKEYADTGLVIAVLSLATLVDALGLIASTGLWAMDRPSYTIIGDVAQLAATLGMAVWLVFPLGALGIALALVVGRTAGAAVRWATLWWSMGIKHCEASV
jgi:O-antigen/teichoic acid export membrane protein